MNRELYLGDENGNYSKVEPLKEVVVTAFGGSGSGSGGQVGVTVSPPSTSEDVGVNFVVSGGGVKAGGVAAGQGGYSGDNIFAETWLHYQIGGRKDLNVSTSSLDFSFVSKKDLAYNSKSNTYSVNLFSLNKLSQTSLALGKVSLNSIGNNRYTINRDYYDFNIEWGQGFSTRNIGTFGAGLIHGPVIDNIPVPLPIFPFSGPSVYTRSGPYWINFSGSVYIKP